MNRGSAGSETSTRTLYTVDTSVLEWLVPWYVLVMVVVKNLVEKMSEQVAGWTKAVGIARRAMVECWCQ